MGNMDKFFIQINFNNLNASHHSSNRNGDHPNHTQIITHHSIHNNVLLYNNKCIQLHNIKVVPEINNQDHNNNQCNSMDIIMSNHQCVCVNVNTVTQIHTTNHNIYSIHSIHSNQATSHQHRPFNALRSQEQQLRRPQYQLC